MMKSILRTGAVALMALALAGLPARVAAQSTNAPSTSKKAEKSDTTKKKSAHPFHGKLAKVDKTAKTITVGTTVYHVTADTKITKNGKAATLDDATEGEVVSGYVKPSESGKMVASSLTLGAKRSSSQGSDKSSDKKSK